MRNISSIEFNDFPGYARKKVILTFGAKGINFINENVPVWGFASMFLSIIKRNIDHTISYYNFCKEIKECVAKSQLGLSHDRPSNIKLTFLRQPQDDSQVDKIIYTIFLSPFNEIYDEIEVFESSLEVKTSYMVCASHMFYDRKQREVVSETKNEIICQDGFSILSLTKQYIEANLKSSLVKWLSFLSSVLGKIHIINYRDHSYMSFGDYINDFLRNLDKSSTKNQVYLINNIYNSENKNLLNTYFDKLKLKNSIYIISSHMNNNYRPCINYYYNFSDCGIFIQHMD